MFQILHQLVAEDSQRVTSSGTGSDSAVGVASGGTGTILDLEGDRGGEGEAREEELTEEVRDEVSQLLHIVHWNPSNQDSNQDTSLIRTP